MAGFTPSTFSTIPADPNAAPAAANPGFTSFTSTSTSDPLAQGDLNQANGAIGDFVNSAKTSAAAQTDRLMNFIQSLHALRAQVMNQAKGAASRGANGQQNPLAVYQAVNELANQAGIPLTNNINQALMQGNNIENTLNTMLSQAAQHYSQLASIQQNQTRTQTQPVNNGGGQVNTLGGGSKGFNSNKTPGVRTDLGSNSGGKPGAGLPPMPASFDTTDYGSDDVLTDFRGQQTDGTTPLNPFGFVPGKDGMIDGMSYGGGFQPENPSDSPDFTSDFRGQQTNGMDPSTSGDWERGTQDWMENPSSWNFINATATQDTRDMGQSGSNMNSSEYPDY